MNTALEIVSFEKPSTQTIYLHAARFGIVEIRKGAVISIKAGKKPGERGWTWDTWKSESGPEGAESQMHATALAPDLTIGRLIGTYSDVKIGGDGNYDLWKGMFDKSTVDIGTEYSGAAEAKYLYMLMNDTRKTHDNQGGVQISITADWQ